MEIEQIDQFDKRYNLIEKIHKRYVEIPLDILEKCFDKYGSDVCVFVGVRDNTMDNTHMANIKTCFRLLNYKQASRKINVSGAFDHKTVQTAFFIAKVYDR